METKTLFKWFWPWEDQKEEIWLREMAQQGWHLAQLAIPGQYTFVEGLPMDMVYRLDFINAKEKKDESYWQLFRDAGWKHVGEMGGWQYFRKLARPGESMEIFSDNHSKIAKYRRVLGYLLFFLLVLLSLVITSSYPAPSTARMVISVLMGLLVLVYAYVTIRIMWRINQLKR